MNVRKLILPFAGALFLAGVLLAWRDWPQITALGEGYVLSDFPTSGLRYIIDGSGQKKIGEQVITHRVEGRRVTGTVRRSMESPEVVEFSLDLVSGQVEYRPLPP
jgi:hypothetical protein